MVRTKPVYITLAVVQLIIATGAIPAGILFLISPDGSLMGMDKLMLADSPFSDYTIPAVFLLIVNGFGNLSGAILSFRYNSKASLTGMLLGVILAFWIIMQVYWMGYISFLQPLMFVSGILETALGFLIFDGLKRNSSSNFEE